MKQLTDDQRQQVADNEKLIYWVANELKVSVDEYYGLLAIELCNTVINYDPTKGSLSNYYKLRANGAMCKEYRKQQAKKRPQKGDNVGFIDNLHHVESLDDMVARIEVSEWLEVESCDILRMKMEGYSQSEIARELGVSQSYVSSVLKKLRRSFDEAYR